MVANVFVLFLGGFDTSSTSASATAWFLANNPDVQEAAYQEIKDAIDANEGSQHLEYEILNSLPYLDGENGDPFKSNKNIVGPYFHLFLLRCSE